MAFRVEISPSAEADAEGILDWLISQQAGKTGLRWYQGMRRAIASLSKLPKRCALARENKDFPFEVRQLLYGSKQHRYRILFTIEGDVVTILHIRHGHREVFE